MAFTHKTAHSIFSKIQQDREKYSEFISLFCLHRGIRTGNDWDRIMALSPVGSPLDLIVKANRAGTDFPHQIAFFGLLHYLAGFLLSKEVHIDLWGQKVYPDIWSIVLAPSGSGKSSMETFLSKVFEAVEIKEVEPFSTAKAFVSSIAKTPKGLLVKDEFAQLLKNMEQQSYLAELKEYFLKAYDNANITRTTGKEKIEAKEPAISVYGSTVDETFTKYVSAEMLCDGFAQRFNYIYCEPRKDKKPFLSHHKYLDQLRDRMIEITNDIPHLKYKLSEKAIKKYEELFHLNLEQFEGIKYSFFRRTHFKTIKYALLYHVMLGKDSDMIDEEDIEWADRITFTHFVDLTKMLDMYDESEAHRTIDRAIELKEKLLEKGKPFTAREILAYLKGAVKNVSEAKLLHSLVLDIEKQTEEFKRYEEAKQDPMDSTLTELFGKEEFDKNYGKAAA